MDKELAALKEAAARAAESLRSAEAANSELRDQLQRGGQELRDLAAAKDARCGAAPASWGRARGGGGGGAGAPLFPLTFPPPQDQGLRRPTSLGAAGQEEGGGGVQEEVSVRPGARGWVQAEAAVNLGRLAFELTARDFLSGAQAFWRLKTFKLKSRVDQFVNFRSQQQTSL